jgi:2-iminobutanoate/2-iminopropanoate deaminase
MPLKLRSINAKSAPEAVGGYSQALETTNNSRRLYISGQIPMARGGTVVPDSFAEQAKLVWSNVLAQLEAADMTIGNLVKVTIFLSDRKYALENRQARQEALGDHAPALTVIIAGIFDEAWLLEIEAIAEA